MNSAFVWDMDPVIFHFGSYTFRWYSFFMLTGWFLTAFIFQKLWREGGKEPPKISTIINYSIIGLLSVLVWSIVFFTPLIFIWQIHYKYSTLGEEVLRVTAVISA
jgi:prolipoprotein diacylglyceryltransferase